MSIFNTTVKTQSNNYLPEVDGLRAIAVVLVLIFHLNVNGIFPGGFIGVDVFFVISGFLITGIIYDNAQKNKFSYLKFIEFRISRLYPALLFTIFFVLAVGFLIYSPDYYKDAASAGRHALLSISNIYFSRKNSYWDLDSAENPFLHTWSLGVEQQFYLFWPLLILLLIKLPRRIHFTVISIVFLCSLCLSELVTKIDPIKGFYYMPTRIFELSAGAALYISRFNPLVFKDKIQNWLKELLFIISILVIVVCGYRYYAAMPSHPGFASLPVVIASLVCIITGSAKYSGKLVRNKIALFIGIISYSVYLIHWPLIVFYKYLFMQSEIPITSQIIIFSLSIIMGYLMYIFIENKFRKTPIFTLNKKSLVFFFIFISILLTIIFIRKYDGLMFRVIDSKNVAAGDFHSKYYGGTGIQIGQHLLGDTSKEPVAIFVGNSYMRQYGHQIDAFFKEKNQSIITAFQDGCPFLNENISGIYGKEGCLMATNAFAKLIQEKNLPVIKINFYLGDLYDKLNNKNIKFDNLEDDVKFKTDLTIKLFNLQSNKNLLILGIPPGAKNSIADCLLRPFFASSSIKNCAKTIELDKASDANNFFADQFIKNYFQSNSNIKFIDVRKAMCNAGVCPILDENNQPIYSDQTHLSIYGATFVWDRIKDDIYSFIIDADNNQ